MEMLGITWYNATAMGVGVRHMCTRTRTWGVVRIRIHTQRVWGETKFVDENVGNVFVGTTNYTRNEYAVI